jgi:hypothetical protein
VRGRGADSRFPAGAGAGGDGNWYAGLLAGWSSQVARWAHNPEVAGSNPAPATKKALVRAVLGQGFFFPTARLLTDLLTCSNGHNGH